MPSAGASSRASSADPAVCGSGAIATTKRGAPTMPALPDCLSLRDRTLELRRLEPSNRDAVFRGLPGRRAPPLDGTPRPGTEEDADRLMDDVRAQWEKGEARSWPPSAGSSSDRSTSSPTATGAPASPTGSRPRHVVVATDPIRAPAHPRGIRDVRRPRPHRALEHPPHEASDAVARRSGFVEEGVLRSRLPYGGGHRDVRGCSLVRGNQGIRRSGRAGRHQSIECRLDRRSTLSS